MNALVQTTRATGDTGVVGMFVPQDPCSADKLGQQGKMAFGFGAFWFNGQQIRTGQATVKTYTRRLANLIYAGGQRRRGSCHITWNWTCSL